MRRWTKRIAKTKANQGPLRMVLRHPEIPLHNNPAELAARGRVRKRVVSYGPRSVQGAQAWDTFQTLLGTAKKLGVNFFQHAEIYGASGYLVAAGARSRPPQWK
jgi:glycine cleavage system aminomethyltransferase T